MGTYSAEMVERGLLPLNHAAERSILSWSSEITSTGEKRGVQGGYGSIEPALVEELPSTFTSKPETGSLKKDLAWMKMNGVNELPRTFHSQDMTGTMKTPKTLDNLAWVEMEPVIIEYEKKVRNWTFWLTLLFCFVFCCFVGGSISICAFAVKFGLPFELLRKKIMKKIPCGKCLDACSKGNYKEAGGHA